MKKVVIIGPESTGKSTLCEQLATHYKTCWCPEFARAYLIERGIDYNYEDLLRIAKGQLDLEDSLLTKAENGIYFIDTDMYVMKVWCEVVYEQCHKWILKQIAQRQYDYYLLCNIDLPWIEDPLREYPDLTARQKLFNMYRDIVINSGVPWAEISGDSGTRLKTALRAIEDFKKTRKSVSLK